MQKLTFLVDHCQPSGSSHCHRLGIVEEQEDLKTKKLLKTWAKNAKEDADRCHAHINTAMRSLHMHTCTHTHTHNLHSDAIAVAAYTYTAIRSLPLHTSTQRYDRCHCMHLHSDTIAANAHASTAIRSLFMNTPAHTHLHSDTMAARGNRPTQRYNRCTAQTKIKHTCNYTAIQ